MLRLRDGLSWCLCDERIVLLDIDADRYFALPPELEADFRSWASGTDNYPGPAGHGLLALGLLVPGRGGGGRGAAAIEPALWDLLPEPSAVAGPLDLLEAIAAQIGARWSLRRRKLVNLLDALRARPGATPSPQPQRRAMRIASAFERSSLFLPKTDRCLPRALAAWSMCRRAGIAASLVFGVRTDPFAAHSWVQLGESVLVGDFEQVRLFTPILVVR